MEWLERLNQAMSYIEDNLSGEIDYSEAAKIACCSTFHFQRMFSYIAGVPLSEYLRRRRLTAAALELQSSDIKVIDLALKYGYDSPTAFARAFQNIHGVSPASARSQGVPLKAFPRMTFQISIKGDAEMNYRIEQKGAFRVVGIKEREPMNIEHSFARLPQFWAENLQNGMIGKVLGLMKEDQKALLGICADMNGSEFDYYIACATDKEVPEDMYEYTVPAARWAIFECIGPMPGALQDLQKRIMSEWLPTSGFEYANLPDIELYPEGDTSSKDYRCEAWLPVVKK